MRASLDENVDSVEHSSRTGVSYVYRHLVIN